MIKRGLQTLWLLVVRNLSLKLFSVAFAFGLWILVNAGERDTEMSLTVPLEWRSLPPHLVVTGPQVDSVDVRVVGPRTLLGLLNPQKVILDLTGMRPGQSSFRIGTERLSLPRGVQLVRVSPSQINLEIARIQKRTLPVHIDVLGEPPVGYKTGEIEVVPDVVEVTGPVPSLARLQSVLTEPLQLGRLTQSTTLDLDVITPQDPLISYNLQQVRVRVDIQDIMLSREFEQVAFTIRNTDLEAEASPAAVDVVVQGPQRVVDQLQLSQDEVFIDAAGKEPGTALIPVTVLVPPEVEIVSQEPKKVSLTLKSRQNEQSKQNEKNESNEQNGQNRLKGEVDDGAGARGEQANTNEG